MDIIVAQYAVCECGAPATFLCADECGSVCADCSAKVHRIARNRNHSVQPITTPAQARPEYTSPEELFGRDVHVTGMFAPAVPVVAHDRSAPAGASESKSDTAPTVPALNGAQEPVVSISNFSVRTLAVIYR